MISTRSSNDNRIGDGAYSFQGVEAQASLNEVAPRLNALHGLVAWVPWRLVDRTPSRVVLAYALPPTPAYPWRLDCDVTYEVGAERGLAGFTAHLSDVLGEVTVDYYGNPLCTQYVHTRADATHPAGTIVFENGKNVINISSYWESVIRGAFLLVVVLLQARLVRRRTLVSRPG